jgi:hypothetical protein
MNPPPSRVGNKNPQKKTKKNHQKWFFGAFLNFKFLMRIIQIFLFETDFL